MVWRRVLACSREAILFFPEKKKEGELLVKKLLRVCLGAVSTRFFCNHVGEEKRNGNEACNIGKRIKLPCITRLYCEGPLNSAVEDADRFGRNK